MVGMSVYQEKTFHLLEKCRGRHRTVTCAARMIGTSAARSATDAATSEEEGLDATAVGNDVGAGATDASLGVSAADLAMDRWTGQLRGAQKVGGSEMERPEADEGVAAVRERERRGEGRAVGHLSTCAADE